MSKVIFLDAGHGGIDLDGKYTTSPGKLFTHSKGIFHQGTTFCEGVKNRDFCSLLHKRLVAEGITVISVYHEYLDTPLKERVDTANFYHKNIAEGIYISEHSNATPSHTARGFQAWTSPGQSTSDTYAEKFLQLYKESFVNNLSEIATEDKVKLLTDLTDGDADYEAKFYVLLNTSMPAILFENLFFDNYFDASILMRKEYLARYVEVQVKWIKSII